jgi:hypothetical protein
MIYLQSVPGRWHPLPQLPPLYRRWRPAAATHRPGVLSGPAPDRQRRRDRTVPVPFSEPGGTTRDDTSRADATGLIPAHRMTGSPVPAARSQPNRSTVQADTPDPHRAPLPAGALRRHAPKVGAQCGNSACWDLCGGPLARAVPTATMYDIAQAQCRGYVRSSSLFPELGIPQRAGLC